MRGTTDHAAFQAFVEGARQFPADSQQEIDVAIESFQLATSLDPNFARAYAWLAYSYLTVWVCRWSLPSEFTDESQLLDAVHFNANKGCTLDPLDYSIRWVLMNAYVFTAKRQTDPLAYYQEGQQQLAWADYLYGGECDPEYRSERMLARAYLGLYAELDDAIELAYPAISWQPWIRWSIAQALYTRAAHQSGSARQQDYHNALTESDKVVNAPVLSGFVVETWLLKAMCHARLSQLDQAGIAVESFANQFAATRPGTARWTLTDEDTSVSYARGVDRRHWIEGLVLALDNQPNLQALVPDPDQIGTAEGLKNLELEDYETSPAGSVP